MNQRIGRLFMVFLVGLACAWPVSGMESLDETLKKAQALINVEKKPEAAIVLLTDLIPFHARDSRLWVALGIAAESAGQKLEALNAYQEANKLSPAPAIAKRIAALEAELGFSANKELFFPRELFRIAGQEKNTRKLELAFREYVRRVTKDPKLLSVDDGGLVETAVKHYQAKLAGNMAGDVYYHAVFSAFAGRVPEAIAGLKKVLAGFPESPYIPDVKARLKILESFEQAQAREQERLTREAAEKAAAAQPKPIATAASSTVPVQPMDTKPASGPRVVTMTVTTTDTRPPAEKMDESRKLLQEGRLVDAAGLMELAVNESGNSQDMLALSDLYLEMAKQGEPAGNQSALVLLRKIYNADPTSPAGQAASAKIRAMEPPHELRVRQVREYFEKHGFPEDR
jgi:tetratricopeptide (TPR) repeat protein